jgi:glycopeptide antibiotics resistance protein
MIPIFAMLVRGADNLALRRRFEFRGSASRHYRRSMPPRRQPVVVRPLAAVMLAAYVAAVGVVVSFPSPVDQSIRPHIYRFLWRAHRRGLPEWVGYAQVEWLANVALFTPIGALIVLALGRRFVITAVAVGVVLSLLAEGAQLLLLPDRFATIEDVLANGVGSAAGALLAGGVIRACVSRRQPH